MKDGWAKLAKNLKAEIDEELIEAYRGTVSLPFSAGEHRRAAVKIIDDRGIESLKVIEAGVMERDIDRPPHHQLSLRGAAALLAL